MTETADKKPTVLVVDDSRLMRVAARKILKNDFDILEAADGEQAWSSLQENPHVILVMSDLSMPNLDGLGLLKRIRESESDNLKTLPVIIVTGAEDDDGSKSTALAAGASDFITKPFESVQLLARAKAQAKQQRTHEALQQSEASKQVLEENASVDTLTGLANHRAFVNHIEEDLSYSMRHRTELALLLVQIDKYKVLFLRRGKQTAEEVLKRIAQRLRNGRRREDTVARIGLDTFGILLPSANPIGARRVAEQLHEALRSDDFIIDGDAVDVTTSFAIACPAMQGESSVNGLLEEAQTKLGLAAKRGGNCIQYEKQRPVTGTLATTPVATPAPAEESAIQAQTPQEAPTASPEEVEKALCAIADDPSCEQADDALVRAVLPLLKHWDQARNGRHSALLEQLESALSEPENTAVEQVQDASLIG